MAEPQRLKLLVLCGRSPRHLYVANALCAAADVQAIVQETGTDFSWSRLLRKLRPDQLARKAWRWLRDRRRYRGGAEARFFFGAQQPRLEHPERVHAVPHINHPEVVALARRLQPDLIAQGDYRMESGYQAMSRFLDQGLPPTAVVAASDLMAVGAMNAVLDRGLRVPHDISVIGFDNIAMASAVRPALTTVAQPMYEIGAIAMERLIRSITGEEEPAVHWIQPSLIIRQSTAPVFGQSST